jgi:hypothetical protein
MEDSMKRSGQVGLVLMGAATFVATFAAGSAVMAWQKPSYSAETAQSSAHSAAQNCTPRPDGTKDRDCEPVRRGFAYYLYPRWSAWSWGWGNSYEPMRRQDVALSNNPRSFTPTTGTVPASGGVERSGFGSSAKGSFRVSAGG